MGNLFLLALYCFFFNLPLYAQPLPGKNALLWKVSGKDLKNPSYLFGTFHFLTNAFVDTIPAVTKAYQQADAVVGELVIDETVQAPLMQASLLQGTTLKAVLPEPVYTNTARWFKAEAGIELAQLDALNPMAVMTTALALAQQKYFPNPPNTVQLDAYFQQRAKRDGKKVAGLETVEVQIETLFKKITPQRQTELLADLFREGVRLQDTMQLMYKAYIDRNLQLLEALMYRGTYQPHEIKALLDDRNRAWLQQLPAMMKNGSLFVAVGALHLTGTSGLVEQLRKQGYTVTPIF